MAANQITITVAERLGIDLYDDVVSAGLQGKIDAVVGVLSKAGCPKNEDDNQYIEAVTIGVNDLLTMESSGGGFSDGFLFFVNQIRFGGISNV